MRIKINRSKLRSWLKTCYYWFFIVLTGIPNELAAVLKQAGKNRRELEKVLKHYGQNPADNLKLCAAEFLIVNMPGYRILPSKTTIRFLHFII
jgi:hypothetical protein